MNADQCRVRAEACAANAQISADEAVSLEFLKLAAQWRAMAARTIFLGSVDTLSGGPAASLACPGAALPDGKV